MQAYICAHIQVSDPYLTFYQSNMAISINLEFHFEMTLHCLNWNERTEVQFLKYMCVESIGDSIELNKKNTTNNFIETESYYTSQLKTHQNSWIPWLLFSTILHSASPIAEGSQFRIHENAPELNFSSRFNMRFRSSLVFMKRILIS